MLSKIFNKFFEWVAGIEMHHCHECREYRFGSWFQAAFAEMDECGCYRRKYRPQVKYIWLCLKCAERLAFIESGKDHHGRGS